MATDATAVDQIARFAGDLTLLHDLHADAAPLLLAVSGGPDSMAMLTLAVAAFPGRIAVATVDHGLRAEAADEVRMVADHCATLGVPHHGLRPGTPIAGASIQSQAREARYALLADHARTIGAAAILTAHHADDQAETFLMRAARGGAVGPVGRAGPDGDRRYGRAAPAARLASRRAAPDRASGRGTVRRRSGQS